MESLSEKLKSLGVQVGVKDLKLAEKKAFEYPIESVLTGKDIETNFGKTFVIEKVYPDTYQHGNVHLEKEIAATTLADWGQIPIEKRCQPGEYLYLDTETSGLAGGTGTFVFMVGLGFHAEDGFHLVQLFMRDPGQEAAFLAALSRYIGSFKCLVTFNGKTFDIPILNTRHVMNGFTPQFNEKTHLDLLHLARRLWRNRLPSRALPDLETQILRLERTEEEVPGWMIPEIYFDYLSSGDARPLAGVFYHNGIDILSLAALYNYLSRLLEHPLDHPDPYGLDLMAIARLYEDLGRYTSAIDLYERSIEIGLPRPFFVQTILRYARMHRQHGDWQSAVQLWQKGAEYHVTEACIELAKYYEHQLRDTSSAINWTKKALERLNEDNEVRQYQIEAELTHRLERLSKKS